jgi:hypothetical protein
MVVVVVRRLGLGRRRAEPSRVSSGGAGRISTSRSGPPLPLAHTKYPEVTPVSNAFIFIFEETWFYDVPHNYVSLCSPQLHSSI